MLEVAVDTTDFENTLDQVLSKVISFEKKALMQMGDELLRLSSHEVPHDEGVLQSSGVSQPDGEDWVVGYHTPYAARLHEHPEFNFQKGRKGKYLEDPLKKNLSKWIKIYRDSVGGAV